MTPAFAVCYSLTLTLSIALSALSCFQQWSTSLIKLYVQAHAHAHAYTQRQSMYLKEFFKATASTVHERFSIKVCSLFAQPINLSLLSFQLNLLKHGTWIWIFYVVGISFFFFIVLRHLRRCSFLCDECVYEQLKLRFHYYRR